MQAGQIAATNVRAWTMILDVYPVLRWRGHKNFVKARHVQPAPAGTTLESAPCLGRDIRTPRWDAGKQPVACVLVVDVWWTPRMMPCQWLKAVVLVPQAGGSTWIKTDHFSEL